MSGGKLARTPPVAAIIKSYPALLENSVIITGTVLAAMDDVRFTPKKYSFHEIINIKIAVEANPGADNGKIIRKNAFICEHPSTLAASSKSIGRFVKYPFIIHITNGSANDR